jgi:hypothetical protein
MSHPKSPEKDRLSTQMEPIGILEVEKDSTSTKPDGSSSLEYAVIYGDRIDAYWSLCSEAMLQAMDPEEGRAGLLQVYYDIKNYRAQLWLFHKGKQIVAAVVTRVYKRSDLQDVVDMYITVGVDLHSWKDYAVHVIEQWGIQEGCAFISLTGRPAWTKLMADAGYKEYTRTLMKRIMRVN